MTAEIIDGKAIAAELRSHLASEVDALSARGLRPGIATLMVGHDFGARLYQESIDRMCRSLGLEFRSVELPSEVSTADVVESLRELNADRKVSGILVLRPLPPHVEESAVAEALLPVKDIDCQHPANLGKLMLGRQAWPPATPAACLELLERRLAREGRDYAEGFAGAEVVIVGRSPSVGRPLAAMLINRHATVTICHSYTSKAGILQAVTRRAKYLVVATGIPEFIGKDHVAPGATVIDVGINQILVCRSCGARGLAGRATCAACGKDLADATAITVGDVDFHAVADIAGAITPVPGGVGAVTNVMLARNAVWAAKAMAGITGDE